MVQWLSGCESTGVSHSCISLNEARDPLLTSVLNNIYQDMCAEIPAKYPLYLFRCLAHKSYK